MDIRLSALIVYTLGVLLDKTELTIFDPVGCQWWILFCIPFFILLHRAYPLQIGHFRVQLQETFSEVLQHIFLDFINYKLKH